MRSFIFALSLVVFTLLIISAPCQALASDNLIAASSAGSSALKFLKDTAIHGGLSTEGNAETTILNWVALIINTILAFVGVIFFILTFWAGFRWMTSGGNETIISEAKKTIKTSLIGIIIILGSFAITNFVLTQISDIYSK